jgi:hypothetical protein
MLGGSAEGLATLDFVRSYMVKSVPCGVTHDKVHPMNAPAIALARHSNVLELDRPDTRVGSDLSRAAALRELRLAIQRAKPDDREAFRQVMVGARELLGYTDSSIAESFSCSRMTANRWIRGEAAPFAGMRLVIFKQLSKEVERALRAAIR